MTLTIAQTVKRLASAMNISEDEARRLVDIAIKQPDRIKLNQKMIDDLVKKEKETRPVKGFQFRRTEKKVGRNDPCPCGSGKKFKLCCTVPRSMGIITHRGN